jgi:arylmalonate decarboxylase
MTIGLVTPGAQGSVPSDAAVLYPEVMFVAQGTGVGSLTPAGYDQAVDKIIPAADILAAQGVDAISLFGTSLTFYRGPKFNEELQDEVRARTGLPVSSMSTAVIDGLRAVGSTHVAVATAYIDVVNSRLRELLEFHGFEVGAIESFGITDFGGSAGRKSAEEIIELVDLACAKTPEADGIVISCGGLRTLDLARPIEARHGLPVVSSTPAALWSAVRLVGHTGEVDGYGSLFEGTGPPPRK